MSRFIRTAALAVGAAGALVAATVTSSSGAGAVTVPHGIPGAALIATATGSAPTCAKAKPGFAACLGRVLTRDGHPLMSKAPSGYGPNDIQSAYGLKGKKSSATVAIVDAQDDPNAESDLASYRSTYGLPACTTANGCFTKVNQRGGTNYPTVDAGWATEISLDLDMVSATCPSCKILLVEADSASFANLGKGVDYAAKQGVTAISNSYGGNDSKQKSQYVHPGIAVTASAGDDGYGVSSPASFPGVIGVGGTSLNAASNSRGWKESAWDGSGSGCSQKNSKPAWQTGATDCNHKAVADVSAVADPNTGVAIYDTIPYLGGIGWQVYGGTSASSPIIASVYALGGLHGENYPAAYTWAHTSSLNDVKSGSNGSCPKSVWCNSGTGWDGPTGLGTPNGTGAF